MSREARLRQLLQHPHIWKSGRSRAHRDDVLPTGFAELDELLAGGWPAGVVTEILLPAQGIGELRLLMPALRYLQQPARAGAVCQQLCWVQPPHIPYAPALAQHGLNLSRLLIVNPETPADALWAAEQALRSGVCAAVLLWADRLGQAAVRRLQVSSESNSCRTFLFRSNRFSGQLSAAPLRIRVAAAEGAAGGNGAAGSGLRLSILRNRYGAEGSLSLPC